MHTIILAAGYATRLYPLTLNQPKPLLPVADKPMIEHVLEKLGPVPELSAISVVTNEKFSTHFQQWAEGRDTSSDPRLFQISVINDHSTDDSNKLGAIGDIEYTIEQQSIDDDLLIVAGDNLFSHALEGFGDACRGAEHPVIGVYDVGDLELIKKYCSISIDVDSCITHFEEKPAEPRSTLTGIALYYYPKKVLPLIRQYLDEGNNKDQPGRLVQWLYTRTSFHTWQVPGLWFDIGSRESLDKADATFRKIKESTD